jgi:hypothetical protein
VTVTGLSLAGSGAANYVLASSSVSAMIGEITQSGPLTLIGTNPVLLSVSVSQQAPLITTLATLTVLVQAAVGPPPQGGSRTISNAVTNLTTSGAEVQAPEPPTLADTATNYIADSMNGSGSSARQVNVIIPGVLSAQSGQQQPPPPGTGDDLSGSGNSSLWQ